MTTKINRLDTVKNSRNTAESQKLILTDYADKNKWEVVDCYVDDGYSGCNFNRPAIKRLIADVQVGKINLVLVKDQSRFGRNVIEAGIIKQTFEDNNVRLIAVNDGLDTANGFDIMSMFRDVFNEWLISDTSKKIRAVKKACAENGKFMAYKAPFGYMKSSEDKHKLVIDEPAAEIVRKIYDLRCKGISFRAIANELNDERVITPKEYHPNVSGRAVIGKPFWNANTVAKILKNEVYIGNMVQGKVEKISYKQKKYAQKPKDEWIRVTGTHEPIIDISVWDFVCELNNRITKPRSNQNGELSLFSGLVRCLDCGYSMKIHSKKTGENKYYSYYAVSIRLAGKELARITESVCSNLKALFWQSYANTPIVPFPMKMFIVKNCWHNAMRVGLPSVKVMRVN